MMSGPKSDVDEPCSFIRRLGPSPAAHQLWIFESGRTVSGDSGFLSQADTSPVTHALVRLRLKLIRQPALTISRSFSVISWM